MSIQEFSASIMAAHPLFLHQAVASVQSLGIQSLHIDIMDDHYVNNLALNYDTVIALAKAFPTMNLDIHLMVNQVENALSKLKNIQPRIISFHPQKNQDNLKIIHEIQKTCLASIAINANQQAEDYLALITQADHCLVMGVQPGLCGQQFQPRALAILQKVYAHTEKQKKHYQIAIDGGVNANSLLQITLKNIPIAQSVTGSALFKKADYKNNFRQLAPFLEAPKKQSALT